MFEKYLDIRPEVRQALENNQAVVALESTIISHGMPYPKNVETALNVEAIVRKNGAIPSTIAILDGRLKVGLTEDEIKRLGQAKNVIKCSRRGDRPVLPYDRFNIQRRFNILRIRHPMRDDGGFQRDDRLVVF